MPNNACYVVRVPGTSIEPTTRIVVGTASVYDNEDYCYEMAWDIAMHLTRHSGKLITVYKQDSPTERPDDEVERARALCDFAGRLMRNNEQ